jgi:hypothetical protein
MIDTPARSRMQSNKEAANARGESYYHTHTFSSLCAVHGGRCAAPLTKVHNAFPISSSNLNARTQRTSTCTALGLGTMEPALSRGTRTLGTFPCWLLLLDHAVPKPKPSSDPCSCQLLLTVGDGSGGRQY